MSLNPADVFLTRVSEPHYGPVRPVPAPELPGGQASTSAAVGLRALLRETGLDAARFGTPGWNPLGEIIRPGSRVLLKPNWVLHRNHSGAGEACLVTDSSVLEAILGYVLLASPAEVVLGDAPVQGCDFEALRRVCGLDALMERVSGEAARRGTAIRLEDFRLTVLPGGRVGDQPLEHRRPESDFVLFDLAGESDLEPVTRADTEFRVTMYDPDALKQTHAPGRHQYLVARDAIDADVVINVPKLKCHKKACVTGALKNLVGINGHKQYLPHHRKGGALAGGDCYPGRSPGKAVVEELMDTANRSGRSPWRTAVGRLSSAMVKLREKTGLDANVEGSWHGNDTVWRMCLDLQRILRYGKPDGTLAGEAQRTVLTITDAIVAGQGNGPLAPTPLPLGVLTLAASPVAAEWVHAMLMGFDPARIPLTREAWSPHPHPLAAFGPDEVRVCAEGEAWPALEAAARFGREFIPPDGWRGHCELAVPARGGV